MDLSIKIVQHLDEENIAVVIRILSLLLYAVTFTISYYCMRAAKIETGKSINKSRIIYLCLAVLIPCVLAGLRSDTVGTDVGVYIVRDVKYGALSQSFRQLQNLMSSEAEFLYCVLVYIATRFTSDAVVLLFLLQMLSIMPCVKAFYLLKDRINVPLAYLIYLLYFYNTSLNVMRQAVACSFILMGGAYLYSEKKYKRFKMILSFIVAILFHRAAILGIILLLFINCFSKFKGKHIIRLLLFVGICFLPTLLIKSTDYLISNPAIPYRYKFYLRVFVLHESHEGYFVNPYSLYTLVDLLFRTLLVVVPIYFAYRRKKNQEEEMLENICLSGLFMYSIVLFSMQTAYGNRVSMFLDYFIMLLASYIIPEHFLSKRKFIYEVILLMSWLIMVMYFGSSGSQNYLFRFF